MLRPPREALPAGTIDTHVHLFAQGVPLASPRSYTPHMLTLSDWRAFAGMAGIARGVVVQPSVYGFDNSVLLAALRAEPERLRGIVVPHPDMSVSDLAEWNTLGVRGIRCNTRNLGGLSFDAIGALARTIAPLDWLLQFLVRAEQLDALASLLPSLGVPAVIDHLGWVDPRDLNSVVRQLRGLLDAGNCYVKISGPYRLGAAPYAAVGALTVALVHSHPHRLIWGTDWPHTELFDTVPDDTALIDAMSDWLSDPSARQQIFVDTPHSLFFAH